MKKHFPTWIHETCLLYAYIFVSAGQRGLQMKIGTADLIEITKAHTADITFNNVPINPEDNISGEINQYG